MTFPSSVKEHYSSMEDYVARIKTSPAAKTRLLEKAKQAAAWGVPDNESTGYSHSELCGIIRQLVNYIEKS